MMKITIIITPSRQEKMIFIIINTQHMFEEKIFL